MCNSILWVLCSIFLIQITTIDYIHERIVFILTNNHCHKWYYTVCVKWTIVVYYFCYVWMECYLCVAIFINHFSDDVYGCQNLSCTFVFQIKKKLTSSYFQHTLLIDVIVDILLMVACLDDCSLTCVIFIITCEQVLSAICQYLMTAILNIKSWYNVNLFTVDHIIKNYHKYISQECTIHRVCNKTSVIFFSLEYVHKFRIVVLVLCVTRQYF